MNSTICPHCSVTVHLQERGVGNVLGSEGRFDLYHSQCPACDKSIIRLEVIDCQLNICEDERIVYPCSSSKQPAPPEVPDDLRNLYGEAASIAQNSPRAAGALLRRALQQIIHDHAHIKRQNLYTEIQDLIGSGNLPSYIVENLESVRVVGNFAAHPIPDQNTGCILDVEIGEVDLCFFIIDQLFDFYFVSPAKQATQKAKLNQKLQQAGKPQI